MRQLIYVCTTFGLFVFFPGVLLSSRVTGACPVTTDLMMRVYVRTTTMQGFHADAHRVMTIITELNHHFILLVYFSGAITAYRDLSIE